MLDREQSIKAQLSFLFSDLRADECVELCALLSQNGTGPWEGYASKSKGGGCAVVAGWYTDLAALTEQALLLDHGWEGRGGEARVVDQGLYVCMNPAQGELAALAHNRLKAGGRTQKKYVSRRVALLIDVDPERVPGISSTDNEKRAAWAVMRMVRDYLKSMAWPEPLVSDSGNGYHALYPLALPGEEGGLVARVLKVLAARFNTEVSGVRVKVDTAVGDPSRLVKLAGTVARKGDNLPDRPHRRSGVLLCPDYVWLGEAQAHALDEMNLHDVLADNEALAAATAPSPVATSAATAAGAQGVLDLPAYLEHYGKEIVKVKPLEGGGTLYVLDECVFDPDHSGGEAGIGQQLDGKLFYQCFHDSCKSQQGLGGSRNWKDARLRISGTDSLRQFYGYDDGGAFVPVPVAGFDDAGPAFTALGSKGTPLAQYENFTALCDHYGVQVRYNEMGKHEDVRLPGGLWGTSDRVRTLARDYIEDLCARHGLASGKLDAWMRMRGEEHAYHPVREWVESKEWDGVGRFEELLATVKVAPGQGGVWRTYLRRWLIQGIAALYEPKFHCRGVLTFTGDQGVGKTSWFKRLVPGNLEAFGEGLSLDPADKDSIIITLSRWVVELGEVDATFRKTDISRLKAFLTKDKDILRVPYGRAYDHWARRTVFGATVNDPQFLMDSTGNTRWWCVETESIDWAHTVDMQQVWAEARAWYELGETWFLDKDETAELNRVNTQFEVPDPIMEAVLSRFDFDAQERGNLMTTTKVLEALGYQRPTKALVTNAGVVLKKLTGGNKLKAVEGVVGRYYEMPPFRDVVSGIFIGVEHSEKEGLKQ